MSYGTKKKELAKKMRAKTAIHGMSKEHTSAMSTHQASEKMKEHMDSIPKFIRRDNKK